MQGRGTQLSHGSLRHLWPPKCYAPRITPEMGKWATPSHTWRNKVRLPDLEVTYNHDPDLPARRSSAWWHWPHVEAKTPATAPCHAQRWLWIGSKTPFSPGFPAPLEPQYAT